MAAPFQVDDLWLSPQLDFAKCDFKFGRTLLISWASAAADE
jgi:hypothetical protein